MNNQTDNQNASSLLNQGILDVQELLNSSSFQYQLLEEESIETEGKNNLTIVLAENLEIDNSDFDSEEIHEIIDRNRKPITISVNSVLIPNILKIYIIKRKDYFNHQIK